MAEGHEKLSAGVLLKPIDLVTMQVRLIGESPLIVHRFDEKSKRQMLDKLNTRVRFPLPAPIFSKT